MESHSLYVRRRVIFLGTSGDTCMNSPPLCATKFFQNAPRKSSFGCCWRSPRLSFLCSSWCFRTQSSPREPCVSEYPRLCVGRFMHVMAEVIFCFVRPLCSIAMHHVSLFDASRWSWPQFKRGGALGARLSDRDLQQPLHSAMPTETILLDMHETIAKYITT